MRLHFCQPDSPVPDINNALFSGRKRALDMGMSTVTICDKPYPRRFLNSSNCFLSRSGSRLPKSAKCFSMSGISAFHAFRSTSMSAFIFSEEMSRPVRSISPSFAIRALANPFERPAFVANPGPQEPSFRTLPEPVHVKDPRGFRAQAVAHGEPVMKVISHVVPAERLHGKGVPPQVADSADVRGCGLGSGGRAHEHAVVPGICLGHERHNTAPPP